MSSWKEVILQDVVEKFIDYRGKTPEKTTSGIPLVTAKIVKNGAILQPNEFVSEETYKEFMTRGFPKINDVVLTTEAPLGEVALLKDDSVALAQRIILIRGKKDVLDNAYLKYFLQSEEGQYRLDSRASGTTVFGIKASVLKEMPILIPPLEEQKAIAEVLSSLDDKIDLLHRQNRTLESLAQTLFRQWFIEEAKEEWEVVTLGDLGKVITGKTPSTSNENFWGEDVFFITPTDFKNYNKYAFSSDRKLSTIGKNKVKNSVLPKNSILVTCIGSDMGKVVITKNECVTNQQINSLVLSNDNLLNEYVFQYLKSIYPLLRAIALGGTTMPIINKTDFENIEILLPTDEVLERFQSITLSSNQKIIENTKQIQTLENLRDTLLPKLLSGEVRVKI